jgi:hypothetical protein
MNQGQDDNSGRQDISSPDATVEKSDPTPVGVKRGQRLLLGIVLVGIVAAAAAAYAILTR